MFCAPNANTSYLSFSSLSQDDIPFKLRCAICNKLAVNAFRLPCCDQAICENCKHFTTQPRHNNLSWLLQNLQARHPFRIHVPYARIPHSPPTSANQTKPSEQPSKRSSVRKKRNARKSDKRHYLLHPMLHPQKRPPPDKILRKSRGLLRLQRVEQHCQIKRRIHLQRSLLIMQLLLSSNPKRPVRNKKGRTA